MLGWPASRWRLHRKGVKGAEPTVSGAELKQCRGQSAVWGPICSVKGVGDLGMTLKGPVYGKARGGATESHQKKYEKKETGRGEEEPMRS